MHTGHNLTVMGAGVMANGEAFVWKARRHRKGRGIGGRFVKHPAMPFAWLDPRPFIHGGPMTATRYCSALLLMMGASFFSFSNAVQISPYVSPCHFNTASRNTLRQSRGGPGIQC